MKITVEKGDLFEVPDSYAKVHCISSDCELGKGIAQEFRRRYPDMKSTLRVRIISDKIGTCCLYAEVKNGTFVRIFNLVTKWNYWDKPTYETLTKSLYDLKKQCRELEITQLAMPFIGCGLDKLEWDRVSDIIKEVFEDTDIEILVRYI